MKRLSFLILHATAVLLALVASSCSAPKLNSVESTLPSWARRPPRAREEHALVYIGIGEDRVQEIARAKADAFALQNLMNDCSLIPKGTTIQDEHFIEEVGLLFRSFATVTIAESECRKAKVTADAERLRRIADVALTRQVAHYQQTYDLPEPKESTPLADAPLISDPSQLFIVRQQVALAKQQIVLEHTKSLVSLQTLLLSSEAIALFEDRNDLLWQSSEVFSKNRPNSFYHEPSAMRDTIQERARLQEAYPANPRPATLHTETESSKGHAVETSGRPQLGHMH